MRKRTFISFLPLFLLFFSACEKQEPVGEYYEVAVPITQSISEFRASVKIQEPRVITEAGKIYSYKDYVFVNDKYQGVHVIDNRDPYAPKKIHYISIPRNLDIAVKNDMLYADSGMDLVVFDISNIENIKQVERVKDVFANTNFNIPAEASFVDNEDFDPEQEVIVGYSMEKRHIEMAAQPYFLHSPALSNSSGNSTGTGGSLARFKIVTDHLYVVDQQNISVFDIGTLSQPQKVFEEYVGWDIETIFNQDDHLFLGSTTGMYTYSI